MGLLLLEAMLQCDETEGVLGFRLATEILGRGRYFTACYWVDGLLIDSGCAHTVGELDAALAARPLRQIVNTHAHEDHFAANARLAQRPGVKIMAHPRALEVMANPRRELRMQLYRRIFWGMPQAAAGEPLGELVETERHRFEVIPTPGHSPDHIALFERERGWLFSGDAFVGGRDRALRAQGRVWEIVASLERLARLEPRLMFVGSGRVYSRPGEALRAKIDYLRELGERVIRLHRRGASVASIYRLVFGRQPLLCFATGGDFTGEHLVRSFLRDPPLG